MYFMAVVSVPLLSTCTAVVIMCNGRPPRMTHQSIRSLSNSEHKHHPATTHSSQSTADKNQSRSTTHSRSTGGKHHSRSTNDKNQNRQGAADLAKRQIGQNSPSMRTARELRNNRSTQQNGKNESAGHSHRHSRKNVKHHHGSRVKGKPKHPKQANEEKFTFNLGPPEHCAREDKTDLESLDEDANPLTKKSVQENLIKHMHETQADETKNEEATQLESESQPTQLDTELSSSSKNSQALQIQATQYEIMSQSKGEAVGVPFQECAETKVRSEYIKATPAL